jgi:hypothetical protein
VEVGLTELAGGTIEIVLAANSEAGRQAGAGIFRYPRIEMRLPDEGDEGNAGLDADTAGGPGGGPLGTDVTRAMNTNLSDDFVDATPHDAELDLTDADLWRISDDLSPLAGAVGPGVS